MVVWTGSPVLQQTYEVGVSNAVATIALNAASHELLDGGNYIIHKRGKFKKNQRKQTKGKRK